MAKASVSKTIKEKSKVDIDGYLTYFNDKKSEVELIISDLQDNITKLKGKIKDTESELKSKTNDVAKRRKVINSKLHDVNGDYKTTHLLQAAEQLKILDNEQTQIEETLNSQKLELQNLLKDEESKKEEAEKKKDGIEKATTNAKNDLTEIAEFYTEIILAIENAVSISDNKNLKIALDEENTNMKDKLEEITDGYISEVNDILDIIKPKKSIDKTEDLFDDKKIIKIEPEKEEPEIKIEDIHKITEYELPEINLDVPYAYQEKPKKIEIELDEPKKEKENYDSSRKIIDIKNISVDQKEAIENSSIVEKGLENFFNRVLI